MIGEAEQRWAEATNAAMEKAAAEENLLEAVIPEFGTLGDLRKPQIEEIARRLQRAAQVAQMWANSLEAMADSTRE